MMNNKYKFINEKRSNFQPVNVILENGFFKISLTRKLIRLEDGFLVCPQCDFTIKKSPNEVVINCKKCKENLYWDLEDKWKKQLELVRKLSILKGLLNPPYGTYNSSPEQIFEAIELLTEEQKSLLSSHLFPLLLITNQEAGILREDKIKLTVEKDNLEKKLSELDEVVNKIQKTKITERLDNFNNRLNDANTIISELEQNVEALFSKNPEAIKQIKQNEDVTDENVTDEQFDLEKMKRTLNIMMELFERGLDFDAILLKAKTNIDQNMSNEYNTSIPIANYNLDYNNNGTYLGNGLSRRIFERFQDI